MKLPVDYTQLNPKEKKLIREEYIKTQQGKCMYCGEDIYKYAPKHITDKKIDWSLFPVNFLKYPIHLQHNHTTGMTEGAVHNYCNAVLW